MKVLRRSITAAEDDYIRIGNRLYPKNAMDYPEGMTADQVSQEATRRRNAEIEQEKADAARQDAMRRGEANRQAVKQAIADNPNPEHPLNPYFEALVPAQGQADTVAGELIRAMMRLIYRDWNDGDVFYSGYGLETCGGSAQYLMQNGPGELYDELYRIAEDNLREDEYTDGLDECANLLVEYLEENPELYGEENTIDSRSYPNDLVEELAPTYDYDFEIPDVVIAHIEAGHIDYSDLEWEISNWEVCYRCDCNVHVYDSYVEITDLPEDDYQELEGHGYEYLEEYGENLTSEYGDPYEEEDEDYDDELDEEYDEVEESTSIR